MSGEGVQLRPRGKNNEVRRSRRAGGEVEHDRPYSQSLGDRTPFGPGGEWRLFAVGGWIINRASGVPMLIAQNEHF